VEGSKHVVERSYVRTS